MSSEGQVPVADASLYYRVCGNGPFLLILPGAHCDADAADAMCERLVDRFTVVTYDRRGQTRSPITAGPEPLTIETHGDDARALLASLTNEPALVFGSSFGGLIGLDLVVRHPESVRLLVAHEAPAWDLLPDPERDRARQGLDDLIRAFHEQGVLAAFQKLAVLTATDLTDREEGVALQLPTPRVAANLKYFFTCEASAVNRYRLDVATLPPLAAPIVPAIGDSKKEAAPFHCAVALAKRLDTQLAELPGGHTGWLLRPNEFAMKLAELFAEQGVV